MFLLDVVDVYPEPQINNSGLITESAIPFVIGIIVAVVIIGILVLKKK